MSAPLAVVGQVVAVFHSGAPASITKVTKVRMRLGKPVGIETANGAKWTASGSEPGPWSQGHIEIATPAHADTIKRNRLASALARVPDEVWRKVPIAVLKATLAAVETAKDDKGGV